MRLQRDPPGEQPPLTVSQPDHRAQQRMTGPGEPRRRDVTHTTSRRLQPKPLTLKRIRRQLHTPRTGTLEHRPPIDPDPTHPQLRQRPHPTRAAVLATTQRARHDHTHRIIERVLHGLSHPDRQHRMRAHLDKRAVALPQQRPDRPLEPHGLAQIAIPVLTVQLSRVQQPTRHRREERHLPRTRHDRRASLQQIATNLLDRSRMRRIVNRNTTRPDTIGLTPRQKLLQRTDLTRHNSRGRTIHRRDRHPDDTLQAPLELPHTQPDRHHPTPPRQTRQRPTTQRDQERGILQRQPTSHTRSRDLTLRMTHHHIRPHTTRPPQPRQRHHHREQHRLNDIDPIQPRRPRRTTQNILQRPLHKRRKRLTTQTNRLSEHPRHIQQLGRHTLPLRTLTREHEHHTTTSIGHTLHNTNTRPPRSQRIELPDHPLTTPNPSQHHRTILEHRPAHQRKTSINQRTRPIRQPPTQPSSLTTQPSRPPPRHHQRHHTPTIHNPHTNTSRPHTPTIHNPHSNPSRPHTPTIHNPHSNPSRPHTPTIHNPHSNPSRPHTPTIHNPTLRHHLNRRLLENHMRIRTTHPKRRHRRPPRLTTRNPRHLLPQQRHPTTRPIHMRRRLIHMQRPRQHPIPHRHHHLDHTSHTRRSLRMTNIRLHRPQPQRTTLPTTPPIRRDQRLRLDRIPQRRTRTMPLHHIHLPSRQTRTRQRLRNHPLLRRPIRRRQPIRSPILIHRTPTHQPPHPTTITTSIRQTLQQQHTHPIRKTRPISTIRKRLTPTIPRQRTLTRKLNKHTRRRHHRHTTSQRQRTLPQTQRLHSQMQRNQRRRTRRINRHRRTLQPQRIGDAARRHAARGPCAQIALQLRELLPPDAAAVVVIHDACEYAGLGAFE